ncbi:hypothetical protein L207DRAFT_564289, partial [Hyaloscypha variabilis F]
MAPALPSPAAALVTEFGYSPRTPTTYAQIVRGDCPRVTIVERKASSLPPSPQKLVEGSPSPTRKKSRLFETLRLLSSRHESIADENGSPKSLKKRRPIADLLLFSSAKSRKPEEGHVHPSSLNKRTEVASSPKKKLLQSASPSRINRRKSLGDIWGSISSRVSPRRGSTSQGLCPDWYDIDSGHSTNLNELETLASTGYAPGVVGNTVVVSVDKVSGGSGATQSPRSGANSVLDGQNYLPQSYREHSISSSLLWCKESAQNSDPDLEDEEELRMTSSLSPNNKSENAATVLCSSQPNQKEEDEAKVTGFSTPNNEVEDEPQDVSSSAPKDKGKQKTPRCSTPVDRKQAKTPDSYLDLLIEACEERKTPDSYLRDLMKAANVDTSARGSPRLRYDSNLMEQLFSMWEADPLQLEDQDSSEDDEHFSAPPPYTLNDLSNVELGEVTYGAVRSQRRAPERPEDEVIVTVREVSGESSEGRVEIDKQFISRKGDRKERYENLMKKPQRTRRSSRESIEERVRMTVAKMTKNFHNLSPPEESREDRPCRSSEQYDFETDQMEVWDSIILGSRTLQEPMSFRSL